MVSPPWPAYFKSESIFFRRTSSVENPGGLEWDEGNDLFKSDSIIQWDYITILCESHHMRKGLNAESWWLVVMLNWFGVEMTEKHERTISVLLCILG